MQRYLPYLLSLLLVAVIVGIPLEYARELQAEIRNFRVVKEGVLYRSGQMNIAGLRRVMHDYGIRTVITLRDAAHLGDLPPDWKEEEFCEDQGINYCRISPRTWWTPGGFVPAEEGVRKFRDIMDDHTKYPVLIHCFAGIHRTGAFCAIYRMEYDHWTNDQAINEVKALGYNNLDDEWDILTYLEHYQPSWSRVAGAKATTDTKKVPVHLSRRTKRRPKPEW